MDTPYKIVIEGHNDHVVFTSERSYLGMIELLELLATDYPTTPPRWAGSNQRDCHIVIFDARSASRYQCWNAYELQNLIIHLKRIAPTEPTEAGISTHEQ